MGDFSDYVKTSILSSPPPIANEFRISKIPVSAAEWESANIDMIMCYFPSHEFAMSKAKDLAKAGINYTEILNAKGDFERAFVTVQNPQDKSQCRLFEIPYQYFDGDYNHGKFVPDSTGFKMCEVVEHIVPDHSQASADKIIQGLTVLPTQARNLVKNEDGKTKVSMVFGGWCFEVGGCFNAWDIEHGKFPLQWKNLMGLDGKPRALDEAVAALHKVGIDPTLKDGVAPFEVRVVSDSMGGPNGFLAKHLLDKFYGQTDVKVDSIVPMATLQSLNQLAKIDYCVAHNVSSKTYDKFAPLLPDSRAEVKIIRDSVYDLKNEQLTYTGDNPFAKFRVNGSSTNNAPGLPGVKTKILDLSGSQAPHSLFSETYIGQGIAIKQNHLLGGTSKTLAAGPSTLTNAIYNPNYSSEETLFNPKFEKINGINEHVGSTLHIVMWGMDRFESSVHGNGDIYQNSYALYSGTGRKSIDEDQLIKAMRDYIPKESEALQPAMALPTEITRQNSAGLKQVLIK